MHLTRFEMYRRIGAAIDYRLQGQILGISGIKNFHSWIDWSNSQVVDAGYPEIDMQRLPYGAEKFDVVISDQVLQYLPNPALGIQESLRVLKKGGLAIHTTCWWNPIMNCPVDHFRYSADGLRALLPTSIEVVECGSWGNRLAILLMLIRDHRFRFMQIPDRPGFRRWLATKNDPRYPIHTWIVARK
jgi:SAM-dependent methyltransferase